MLRQAESPLSIDSCCYGTNQTKAQNGKAYFVGSLNESSSNIFHEGKSAAFGLNNQIPSIGGHEGAKSARLLRAGHSVTF